MPAPSVDPTKLDPTMIAPAASYRTADPVWVFRSGTWHAGIVVAASQRAATVTYRLGNTRATVVDTLTAPFLVPRADVDPMLDHRSGFPA